MNFEDVPLGSQWLPVDDPKPKQENRDQVVEVTKAIQTQVKEWQVRENGSLALHSFEEQLAFAKRLLAEKMVSESFKTPQQLVIGFQYAKALGIPEILAVKMMYVVNGRPCLYAEGPLALVQRSGKMTSILESFIDENGDVISAPKKGVIYFGAKTSAWRQGDLDAQVDWFTLDDLERAKMDYTSFGKRKEVWVKNERLMMRYKARSMALKTKFADCLAGMHIVEHDFDGFVENDMFHGRMAEPSVTQELNDKYINEGKN